MRDTPLAQNGPFSLKYQQGQWVIAGKDGHRLAELSGQLIDCSGREEFKPDGVIRSAYARGVEAQFVWEAMNNEWKRRYGSPEAKESP